MGLEAIQGVGPPTSELPRRGCSRAADGESDDSPMADHAPPVCFHCGQATESQGEEPRLNRLPDGRPCPICADRLLQMLPSLVRGVVAEMRSAEESEGGVPDSYLPDEPA